MHVRGRDLWPSGLAGDLVEEVHHGWRVACYPAPRPRTLVEVLDRAADRFPRREAVVEPARRLTWEELRAESRRMAGALRARHAVEPGDRVALLLRNGAPFCVALFACAHLGAIAVTLNTRLRTRELAFMLRDSGARVLLANAEWWPEVAPVRAVLPLEACYLAGGLEPGTEPLERLTGATGPPPPVAAGEDDTAAVLYTSGTTGHPKGARITHLGVVNAAITYERCLGLHDDERSLVAVPLFHVTGLVAQLLTTAHVGGTAVVMPAFDAAEAVRLLDVERITHMVAAPTVYVMMMAVPGHRAAGRHVRSLAYGGAPTPSRTIEALRAWLPGARLHNAYGMTETHSPTTILPDADALRMASTVGRPVPTAEVRTVDPVTGRECGADEVGELRVRGPLVVPGYWGNPEASGQAIAGGWLGTGDLARVDAEGFVTIMDRIKDMINRGGEKIYCVEVEEVLCGHPGVLEAAVVGVPDPVYGEAVRACVVPRPGATVDPEDARAWVASRLARYKVPREVVVLDALPRNPGGKVVKRALR